MCFIDPMYLDKIYTLKTGVSFKVSTIALQELIINTLNNKMDLAGLKDIRCVNDLYAYLTVIVYEGAEDFINRRSCWANKQIKANLIAGKPVSFNSFCDLFWRDLDEDDPDGDEWQQLIASDGFYSQLVVFMNKLRIAERNLQQYKETNPDWYLGSV